MGDGINRRAGVDAAQTFAQLFAFTGDIGFGQQNTVSIAHLRLGDGELIHLLIRMDGIHQRDHAIQQVTLTEDLMGKEGLDNRTGIGHTGALDHQAIKGDVTAIKAIE